MRTIIPKNASLIPKEAERVFKGIIYDVYHWPQKMYDGSTATFERLRRRDTVKVIIVRDGKIVFLEEEQPTHTRSLVLPGGRHDVEGETELDCAKREVKEETGMTFKTWRLLMAAQTNDEIDYLHYIFLATDVDKIEKPHYDNGEKIALCELAYDEVLERVEPTFSSLRVALDVIKKAGSVEGLLAFPKYES